jgi:circadian clock protein KaiC
MGGGILAGNSVLVAGSGGTGKSILAAHFIAEGLRAGEPGIVAVFEERPEEYVARAKNFGLDLETGVRDEKLTVLYFRTLDLSVDEMVFRIFDNVLKTGARRLVIDSLEGLEINLSEIAGTVGGVCTRKKNTKAPASASQRSKGASGGTAGRYGPTRRDLLLYAP